VTLRFEVKRGPDVAAATAAEVAPPLHKPIERVAGPPVTIPEALRHRQLAGGRRLAKLLFATNSQRLTANIGAQECKEALQMIRDAGQKVLDVPVLGNAVAAIRKALDRTYAGVVLLGGYDVLPAQRLDVLTAQMRAGLGGQASQDDDGFIVWSDSHYGDVDGDGLAELPVSRIPDARSSKLVFAALGAGAPAQLSQRFGIRNSARPFAEKVWQVLPGSNNILVSGPTTAADVQPAQVNVPEIYFMLHGSDTDSSRFWGEVPGCVEAINVGRLPAKVVGQAFAGCCWGALTTQQTAFLYAGGPLAPKTVESSIALSLLAAGALAFVGCTGTHYSPDASAGYFGGPMHLAFWNNLVTKKLAPAKALFQSRTDYLAGMPHGQTSLWGQAVERKILMQFTCLGLGW